MDIRNLAYFIEVARQKNFSKAAETLHVSQPSISKAVKDLENRLNVTLFYRSTKYVELTDAGETILEQAQQIVSSFQNLTAQLDGLTQIRTGTIHIGFPPITAVTSFSHLLSAFRRAYPQIQIHLYESGPKKVEASVQDGLLDLGLFTPDDASDEYDRIWFEQDPLDVILHPGHPLTSRSQLVLQDLAKEQFILFSSEYKLHDMIIDCCKKAGFSPSIALETAQRELMTQMVAANMGIALLPHKICAALDPAQIASRPLSDPTICLRLALVWKKRRYLSHAARELLTFAQTFQHK
ncbi:LysR family transcriptional regulator [Azotosporobacter soli]|uniref:LysR family transcriptional regulator n=1 Tax=Azotosporobacter soli TaxID=3055040 RepID=UPI0031FECAFE